MSLRLLAALLLVGPTAAAQTLEPDARPMGGVVAPRSGEAVRLALDVRAEVEATVDGCVGFVGAGAPDAVVEWAGGDLRVWTRAPFDATLLVAKPDGTWACDDDTESNSPVVALGGAAAGRYAVWVGSYGPAPADPAAVLYAGAPPVPALNGDAPAAAGVIEVGAGFEAERGAVGVAVDATGPDWAGGFDDECFGGVDADQPTARVRYTAGDSAAPLVVQAEALDRALTVVVERPDGTVECGGFFNSSVTLADAESGDYAVWVGTTTPTLASFSATLTLSETDPDPGSFGAGGGLAYAEGTYVTLDLTAPPARLTLADDGRADLAVTASVAVPNPVQGLWCIGSVGTSPTAALTLSGGGPVAVTTTDALSEADLVMILRTPSGVWFCSDDADGADPGVQIDTPEAGDYLVWVGTSRPRLFGRPTEVAAVLSATRGDLVVTAAPPSAFFESQSPGTYDADELRPGGAAVVLGPGDEVEVLAGGPVLNPVVGVACAGFVGERPTAEVAADGPLSVSATSDTDLTLLVRTGGGAWLCSDDADGVDPRVEVEAPGGAVSVWVGTFSRPAAPVPALLRVERR